MATDTKLLFICFAAGAFALVYVISRVLGTWHAHHLERHNLVVQSKRRRLEYQALLDARENPEASVEIEQEQGDVLAAPFDSEPAMAQAA